MAAPNSAYRAFSYWLLPPGAEDVEDAVEHLLAILQTNKATHLARFYLDDVVAILGADGVTEGVYGVIYPGTDNYQMHNISRHGAARHRGIGNGVVLNDAGLNTLGIAIMNTVLVSWANNVMINMTHRSSWYDNSSQLRVRFRVGSGAWLNDLLSDTVLPQQTAETKDRLFNPIGEEGQVVEVQAGIVNPEGTYYSPSMFVPLGKKVTRMLALFRPDGPCALETEGEGSAWIFEEDFENLDTIPEGVAAQTGIYFYNSIYMDTPAPAGWYFGLMGNRSFYVSITGEVQRYLICAPPPVGTIYVGYEYDFNDQRTLMAIVNSPAAVDITITGRIDTNPSSSTPNGQSFTIVIPAGQNQGMDANFDLDFDPLYTYYWQTVTSIPSGYTIITQNLH